MKLGEMNNRERLLEGIRKSRWAKVVSVLASITVFCTTYAMVLPAVTMSNQDALCGWVEHEHDDTCYNDEGEVICGLEPHVHTLQCYSDMEADIENHDIWDMENPDLTGDRNADVVNVAVSLIGYRESDRNYLVSDGQTRGYTRFGHWYGDMEDEVIREAFDDVVRDIITEIGTDLAEDTTGGAAQRFYSEIDAYNAAREAGTLYAEANEVSDEGMYASANATASDADNDADIDEAVGADGVADADSAQNADKAANADTAQDAGLAVGADFAQGAEFAANADSAQGAEFAASADSAQGAEFAADADSARDAGFAANADSAQTADAAAVADFAQSAEFAANEAPAQDAEVGAAADSAQNAEDTADGTPETDSQDGNYTISIEAALALLEEAAANIGSAADSQDEFIAPEAINIQPADEGAAADAQAANEGVAASAQVADEDAEASAQAANEAAAADVQTANKDAEASAQAANKDAAADAHAANESLAANASADANFTPDEASYRMKLLAIATLIEDGRDQGDRISPVSEPSDILLGIDQYLSGDITPDCAAEVVHFIAYLRLYDIADRLPAKIAEKRVGMLPADIVEGHSQKLSNGIPAASYDDWNAMFVSYVLNFAQVYDMGAEVDAGNWAGVLAMSGRYADAADYIPEPGDLVFFTPQDGSDTRVGIVSQVNKALFGLGSVKSISVILGDEDNEVQEIRVAVGDVEDGDVIFHALQGYGIVTPRDPEEVAERDNSHVDSIVDFITGLVSPGAPQDENVSEEAAKEQEGDVPAEDILADDGANEGEFSEEPDPADTANTGAITEDTGHMIGKTEEDLEDPEAADESGKAADEADAKDGGKGADDADAKDGEKRASDADAKDGDKKDSDADVKDDGKEAAGADVKDGKKENAADGESEETAKASDDSEEKSAEAQSVSDASVEEQTGSKQADADRTPESTQTAEGTAGAEANEEQIPAAEPAEDGTPSVAMTGSEFTEDGTALIMDWNITAQLSKETLPAGAVLRIDTATGKLHTMTAAQAKKWAGNVRIGGREETFADNDKYALTFIGGNGLLYSWEDVLAMKDDSTTTFTGIHVKVLGDDTSETGETDQSALADEFVSETEQAALADEASNASGSLLEMTYQTTAFLKDANNGHNYYITKAAIAGKTATGSFIFENGDAVTVDQDLILRDANLDETGHAAKEPGDGGESAANGKSGRGTDSLSGGANAGDSANAGQVSDFTATDWPKTLTADGPDYTVTMTYGPYAGIPDIAKLKVTEIKAGTQEYESYLADAREALGLKEDEPVDLLGRFFDIKIITKQGEFEPEVPVTVNIEYKKALETEDPTYVSAVHFDEEGAKRIAANATEADGETKGVEFEAESFSVYGIVYTVDYSYDGYVYYISEAREVPLRKIITKLGIIKDDSDETYKEFFEGINSIKSSKDSVTFTKDKDWAIKTAEDFAGAVITVTLEDETKYVIALAKAGENDILTAMAGGYTITVDLGESLPEGSYRIDVTQASANKRQIAAIENALVEKLPNGITKSANVSDASVLDISIVDLETGKEIEPTGPVTVTIEKAGEILPDVVHFMDDGTTELLKADENTFVTESFSAFTGGYTVDFHYSGLDFSMVGEGSFLLSDFFDVLEIEEQVESVENVTFTDASLVDIVSIKEDTTLGDILEQYYLDYYRAYANEQIEDVYEQDTDSTDFIIPEELYEKQVKAGEWVMVSLKPFTTEETLTITMKDGHTITVDVTDAMSNPMFGQYAIEDIASSIDASVSSSVENTTQARNASFSVKVNFAVDDNWLPWLKQSWGFPTLTYDLRDLVSDSPLKDIANTRPATWYAGSTPIGQYWFQDNVAYLQITNLSWLRKQSEFGGEFSFRVSTAENELGALDEYYYEFPGDTTSIHIKYKPLSWDYSKTSNYGSGDISSYSTNLQQDDQGRYYIDYTVMLGNPTKLTELSFTDQLTGNQKIDPSSVQIQMDGHEVRPPHIKNAITSSLNVQDNQITFSAQGNKDNKTGNTKAEIEKGKYTVSYRAYVDMDSVSGTEVLTNKATWTVNGTTTKEPPETKIQIEKQLPAPPPMEVTKNVTAVQRADGTSGNVSDNWLPGDTVSYEIWYGSIDNSKQDGTVFNSDSKNVRITDSMTNIQKLNTPVRVEFFPADGSSSFSINMPTAANYSPYSGGNGGIVWNPEGHNYSVGMTDVFNYDIPNDSNFQDENGGVHDMSNFKGKIKVTYTTEIISNEEALQASPPITNLTATTNKAEADGVQDYKTNKVEFPPEPEHTKTITKAGGGTVGEGDELEPGQTYTYTLTYGSKGMKMKGVNIKDSMSALVDIVGSDVQGATLTINGFSDANATSATTRTMPMATNTYTEGNGYRWKINSSGTNSGTFQGYANETKSVFDYTFPDDDTFYGPVTITYNVKVPDKATLKSLGFYGSGNVNNSFRAGGSTKETHNTVPGNKPITVSKSASVKNTSGNNWQPGDEVEYTVTYGDEETLLGGVVLSDVMTDVQTLTTPVTISYGSIQNVDITTLNPPGTVTASDNKYSTNYVDVFSYTVPANTYGPITVTYKTKIIDAKTAAKNGIYGLVGAGNTAKTDKGGESNTQGQVDYGPKPVIPHTKTVDKPDTVQTGKYSQETAGGWQENEELTYTTTFGDENTELANVWLKDSMTQLQDLIGNLVITLADGSTTTIDTTSSSDNTKNITDSQGKIVGTFTNKWAESHGNTPNNGPYNENYADVFRIEFNDAADQGPVTVTYQTKVISKDTASANNILGVKNVNNIFSTPEGNNTINGTVPFEEEPFPKKTMESVQTPSKKAVAESGINARLGTPMEKGESYDITLEYGKTGQNMSGMTIYDAMTNLADVVGDVKIEYLASANASTPTEVNMPATDNEYSQPGGFVWNSKTHEYGSETRKNYNGNEQLTVFNYTLPEGVYGPVKVKYRITVPDLTPEQIKSMNLDNNFTFSNRFTVDYKTAITEGELNLKTPNHHSTIDKTGYVNPDGSPAFKLEDGTYPEGATPTANNDDGTVTWYIRVSADADSEYPLSNVYVNDTNAQYSINNWASSGDMVAERWFNYKKAVVRGEQTGIVYTPGPDYTVSQELTGSTRKVNGVERELGGPIVFHFDEITEPLIIELKGELPAVLLGNYELNNRVNVKDDSNPYGFKEASAQITGENTDLVVVKDGYFDEEKRIITWTVVLNPNKAEVETSSDVVEFSDILPDGMTLLNYESEAESNPTIVVRYEGGQWGEKTFDVTTTGNKINALDIRNYQDQPWLNPPQRVYQGSMSGTKYTVSYKTRISDDEWKRLTSSATFSEDYTNIARFTDGGDNDYTAVKDVHVEATDFIQKYDISESYTEEGIDEDILTSDDITYKIDVNPHSYRLNNGRPLSLYDTISTNMDIRTGSYMDSYLDEETGEIKEHLVPLIAIYDMGTAENPVEGEPTYNNIDWENVRASYNDDTRQLIFENLLDEHHYIIIYKCRVRSLTVGDNADNFENTATLVGGGTYSDTISDSHMVYMHSASAYGALSMIKTDENDVNHVLEGAEFKLYECITSEVEWEPWPDGWGVQQDKKGWYHEDGGKKYYRIESPTGEYYKGDEGLNKIPKSEGGGKITGEKQIVTSSKTSDGIFRSDEDGIINFGHNFNGEGNDVSFKYNTLYYWIETKAPENYYASSTEKHYFVLYDESDEDYAYRNKWWAWDLDNAWQKENGITVASLSNQSTWTATNSETRSINVQKVWSGDYQNAYETRPDSITLTLMQKSADGTVVEYHAEGVTNPINMSGDDSDQWPSVTWTRLPVMDENKLPYSYYVVEDPVPGYLTKYSDNQQGIEGGKITVTNSLIPSTTKVKVKKEWEDGNASDRPTSVKVTLKQIPVDSDGISGEKQKPIDPSKRIYAFKSDLETPKSYEYRDTSGAYVDGYTFVGYTDDGQQQAIFRPDVEIKDSDYDKTQLIGYGAISGTEQTLIAGTEWSYEWSGLPTKDSTGGTYVYTVEESDQLEGYTVTYSDGQNGVISDTVTITNTKTGKMQLKKTVTVNGKVGTRTEADGTYTFVIRKKDSNAVAKTVSVTFENGVAVASTDGTLTNGVIELDGLAPGVYTVHENPVTNGTTLLGENDVEVLVQAGDSADVQVAAFTNNIDTVGVSVSKAWVNGTNSWPADVSSIEVTLMQPDGNGGLKPADYPAELETEHTQILTKDNPTYFWTNTDPDIIYSVKETAVYLTSAPDTRIDVTDPNFDQQVNYEAVTGSPDNSGNIKITNYEFTKLQVEKQWDDCEPSADWKVDVQLLKSEKLVMQDGNPVQGTEFGDYTEVSDSDIPSSTSGVTITLQKGTNTSGTFDHLPKYRQDGRRTYAIRYKAEEAGVWTWDSAQNKYVLQQNKYVSSVTLKDPAHETDDNDTPPSGYIITNREMIELPVKKSWPVDGLEYTAVDSTDENTEYVANNYDVMMDIESVEFELYIHDTNAGTDTKAQYADGTLVPALVITNPNKNLKSVPGREWTRNFTNLPKLPSGQSYVIKETKVTFKNGSVVTGNDIQTVFGTAAGSNTSDKTHDATNPNWEATFANTWPTTAVPVTKSIAENHWNLKSGTSIDPGSDGYGIFVTLYRMANGKEVPVTEDINGNSIANPIVLTYSNGSNQSVTIPEELDVHSRAAGEPLTTYKPKGSDYTDSFNFDLPKYETVNGTTREITYTVRETAIYKDIFGTPKDVTSQFVPSVVNNGGTLEITNKEYEGTPTKVRVEKEWVLNGEKVTDSAKLTELAQTKTQTFKLYRSTTPLPGSVSNHAEITNITGLSGLTIHQGDELKFVRIQSGGTAAENTVKVTAYNDQTVLSEWTRELAGGSDHPSDAYSVPSNANALVFEFGSSDISAAVTNCVAAYSVPELTNGAPTLSQDAVKEFSATKEFVQDITLPDNGNWYKEISDLPMYADPSGIVGAGNSIPYFYFVVEDPAEGDTTYSAVNLTSTGAEEGTADDPAWTVTNKITEIEVKKQWLGDDGSVVNWPSYTPEGGSSTLATIGYLIYQDIYVDGVLVKTDTEPMKSGENGIPTLPRLDSNNGNTPIWEVTDKTATSGKISVPAGGVYVADGTETGLEAGRKYICEYRYRVVEALDDSVEQDPDLRAGTHVGGSQTGAIGITAQKAEKDENNNSLYVLSNKLTKVKVEKTWQNNSGNIGDYKSTLQLYRRTGEKPEPTKDVTINYKFVYYYSDGVTTYTNVSSLPTVDGFWYGIWAEGPGGSFVVQGNDTAAHIGTTTYSQVVTGLPVDVDFSPSVSAWISEQDPSSNKIASAGVESKGWNGDNEYNVTYYAVMKESATQNLTVNATYQFYYSDGTTAVTAADVASMSGFTDADNIWFSIWSNTQNGLLVNGDSSDGSVGRPGYWAYGKTFNLTGVTPNDTLTVNSNVASGSPKVDSVTVSAPSKGCGI